MSGFRAGALSAAGGAALAALAFTGGGGTDLGRSVAVEIALVLAAAVAVALLVLRGARPPLHGAWPVLAFGLLAALTTLSIAWSITPDLSLEESGRTLGYFAAFTGAVALARLSPRAIPLGIGAILLCAAAVALWALATRVWPGTLADEVLGARLGAPFDYWNALACVGAVALAPALWAATRDEGGAVLRAAAYPLLGVLALVILLTQSRGGILSAVIAVALWLAFAPRRLHSLAALTAVGIAIAPVTAWALSKSAFTEPLQPLADREAVAGTFGLLLFATLVALVALGVAAARRAGRPGLSLERRRLLGVALATAGLIAFTGAFAIVAGTNGGIGQRIDELTAEDAAPPGGAARLGSVSSERSGYWREAREVAERKTAAGAGAGSFGVARLPFRRDRVASRYAHGYLPQTAADLGAAGLVASAALLIAWLFAAARSLGLRRGRPSGAAWQGERAAVLALAAGAVAYGAHSALDWTWFVPGPTILGLLAAGLVAGRGPLEPAGASAPRPEGSLRRPTALRAVAAAACVVAGILGALSVWQPQRAERANERALERLESDPARAVAEARRARDIDPLSPKPLYTLATAERRRGNLVLAFRALERAIREHPADPDAWVRMARFELEVRGDPISSIAFTDAALARDPYSPTALAVRTDALRQGGALPAEPQN